MDPTPLCPTCCCRHFRDEKCGYIPNEPHTGTRQKERQERHALWASMNRHERRAAKSAAKRSR